jgi:hypothetical protein
MKKFSLGKVNGGVASFIKIDVLVDDGGGEIKCFHVLMADIVEYLMKKLCIFPTRVYCM